MSSFTCSAKHYNSIESALHQLISKDMFCPAYELKEICPNWYERHHANHKAIKQEFSEHIDTIRELNALCVSLQYKDHYEGVLDKEIKEQIEYVKEKTEIKYLTPHGLYNALRCANYQIEIEHLQELRKLTESEQNAMKFLEVMINHVGAYIISQLPDDKSNTHSID